MIVLDTSTILAILLEEEEAASFRDRNALRERRAHRSTGSDRTRTGKSRGPEPVHSREHEGRSAESREWVPEPEETREQPEIGMERWFRRRVVLPIVK